MKRSAVPHRHALCTQLAYGQSKHAKPVVMEDATLYQTTYERKQKSVATMFWFDFRLLFHTPHIC